MKMFRQKDELFELMARQRERQRGPSPGEGAEPSGQSGPVNRGASGWLGRKPGQPASAPAPVAGPIGTASGGGPRGFFAAWSGSAPRKEELVEVDGDPIVVVDDGFDAQHPEPGPTVALRADTAIVGGLLVVGLLVTAFLVGRTTTTGPSVASDAPVTIEGPIVAAPLPASAPRTEPDSVPASGGRAEATSVAGGFRPEATLTPPATPPGAPGAADTPPQRAAQAGKWEIRVVTTSPENAAKVAAWLNEAPRSPIFGRGDLQASVKDGSVKIRGFARQESDVLARVRATPDPTGGTGTFNDAYGAPVRP